MYVDVVFIFPIFILYIFYFIMQQCNIESAFIMLANPPMAHLEVVQQYKNWLRGSILKKSSTTMEYF